MARLPKGVRHFFHWTFSILLNVFVVFYMPHFLFSQCVVCLHHFNVYSPAWKVLYSPLKPVIKQKDFSVTCSGFPRSQSVQCNFLGRLRDHEWVVAPLCGRVARLLQIAVGASRASSCVPSTNFCFDRQNGPWYTSSPKPSECSCSDRFNLFIRLFRFSRCSTFMLLLLRVGIAIL